MILHANPGDAYLRRRQRAGWVVLIYVAIAVAAIAISPSIGPGIDIADERVRDLILEIRRSRALLAAAAGGGLALAGVLLQSLLRNPLATPYTLGVSSAASLGAVLALTLGFSGLSGPASFLGAAAALGFVYLVARSRRGGVSTETLLLAGVATSTCAGALILFLLYSADQSQTRRILHWLVGSVPDDPLRGMNIAGAVGAFSIAGLVLAMIHARDLDVLVFGDTVAAGRGVEVAKLRVAIYVTAGAVTAAVVAATGPIGFVGLVIPHVCRLISGPAHRVLVPASFCLGAAYLALADALSRTLLYPRELPVGILTAAIGGPVFAILLTTRKRRNP